MHLPKPGLGSCRNPQNSTLNQSIINSKNLFPHNFGRMLSAGWMLLILLFFFFWSLPDVLGNDVYDVREGRNVWMLEMEVLDWIPRNPACRAGSVLESTLHPFSSTLSSLAAQGMTNSFSWQAAQYQVTSRESQPCKQKGFVGIRSHLGRQYNSTSQRSPFHAPAVSWLGGPSYVAVMFPLVRRAASVVRAHRSD